MIYLDNAATTFPKPEIVYTTTDDIQRNYAVNAGRGSYRVARMAADIMKETRCKLADLVKCADENKIIFAPSSTIAMNQVLNGLQYTSNTNVYVSPFEHNAVMRPLTKLAKEYGFKINILPFDKESQELNFKDMANQFVINHPDIVIINHISNVTGCILPIECIFTESKKYDSVNILDASQSLGLLKMNINDMSLDFLVFAGHKNLYSNIGIGGFICNTQIELNTFITGGTGSDSLNTDMPGIYPVKYEAASQNILAIASLKASLEWLNEIGIENLYNHKNELTQYAVEKLSSIPSVKIYLPKNKKNHIAVISFTHEQYKPEELAAILDMDFDIAVRCGYHCAPLIHELIGTVDTNGTVRISLGYFNTKADIDILISALSELE